VDRRRFVRPNQDWSTITTVLDLENAPAYQGVADTWQVTPPPRKPQLAVDERRYGGARTVGETHDNGAVAWTTLVGGASADASLVNLQALLAQLEQVAPGLYLEWRPDGATNSVFYEVRGPATWKPNYRWVQFAGIHSLTCEIQVPVAPLAVGAPMVIGPFTQDLPAVIELDQTIPGDATALMTVKIALPSGIGLAPWGLIAWAQHPGAGLGGGDPSPLAILTDNAFPGTNGHVYGTWRSDASVVDLHTASFDIDTTRIPRDPFSDELLVEVWGRFELPSTVTDARATLLRGGPGGDPHDEATPSPEFGLSGKPLVSPVSGSALRFFRLGTLPVANDDLTRIYVDTTWTLASGYVGLDYLLVVPAAQRAAGATGQITSHYSYPYLFPIAAVPTAREKAILPDLSGRYGNGTFAAGALPPNRHGGLGGSPLEVPPGDVDVLVKMSSMVPEDPLMGGEGIFDSGVYAGVAVTFIVQPRWLLARGA
jgi:hypothetical protein